MNQYFKNDYLQYLHHSCEKIKNLLSNQCGLQEEVEPFSKLLQDSSVPGTGVTPVPAHVCMTIADELASGERKKEKEYCNLPEAKDREADRFSALSLIKTVCIQS